MTDTRLTVLMSVCNGERYVSEAITSILNQTFSGFEFIIIDDGSTDRTPEILRSNDDPRIRVIRNDRNIGLTKSLNIGLEHARGELIARMDADDVSLPERLEKQMRFMESHPGFALVGSSAELIDENHRQIGKRCVKQYPGYSDLLLSNQFIHGSVLMRKTVLDEVGKYDEDIRYAQDYDLWLRISKDHKMVNLPGCLYRLRLHKDAIKIQKAEESALYHIFVKKMAMNTLAETRITTIRENISEICRYLDDDDLFFLYGARSEFYLEIGDMKNARLQFRKRFRIRHRLLDLTDYFLTYGGATIMNGTKKIRRYLLTRACESSYRIE